MRNLLALAALGLLIFLGMGWYLGWYNIHSAPSTDGQAHFEIDLNTNKIKTDVGKGEEKLHDVLNSSQPTHPQNSTPPTSSSTTNPSSTNPSSTNATTTSFRTGEDGSIVFPGVSPTPPGGGATLPAPR